VTVPVLFAHAESGPVDLTGLVLVAAVVAVAATWLVATNRRLDAKEHPVTDTNGETNPGALPRWAQLAMAAGLAVFLVGGAFLVYRAQTNLSSTQAQDVVDDLCLAADQATTDPSAALAAFDGSPHDALHALDTELRRIDPLAAVSLATAKADAETALVAQSSDAEALTRVLAEETAVAYRTVEGDDAIVGCD
jgi:hypothetical protein